MKERLQKIMSRAGIASRRKAETMILEGRVAVDGTVVTALGEKFDPSMQKIVIDGTPLPAVNRRVYYILNKPKGYISSALDERGRKTVLDLLDADERVYPIGRLDQDTEGLILISNDGLLTNGLLHPRYTIDKTYVAKVKGTVARNEIDRLRHGVMLEGDQRITSPAKVKILWHDDRFSKVELTIHEGRNRQVRRMFAAVGHEVIALKRTKFATLTLDGLKRGEFRELTEEEVNVLYELAGVK